MLAAYVVRARRANGDRKHVGRFADRQLLLENEVKQLTLASGQFRECGELDFPDFTRGAWQTRPPLGIIDVNGRAVN